MRATLARVAVALCAGRSPIDVAIRLYATGLLAAILYAAACVFLVMEPLP